MSSKSKNKVYSYRLCAALRSGNQDAFEYVEKRWPGAKEHPIQGSFGFVFDLPDGTVLKFTNEIHEIEIARKVKLLKPKGVVPVLATGRWWYQMPRLVEGKRGEVPDAPGIDHDDSDPCEGMAWGRNIMMDPETGEYLYIDLSGIVFLESEEAEAA